MDHANSSDEFEWKLHGKDALSLQWTGLSNQDFATFMVASMRTDDRIHENGISTGVEKSRGY